MNVIPFPQRGIIKSKRALIIEDESLMSLLLEYLLQVLGYTVVGMCPSIEESVSFIEKEQFDFAVVDINLRGSDAYSVADKLTDSGIPFIFSTGYDIVKLLKPYREYPTLHKPYELKSLKTALEQLLSLPKEKAFS
jgi:CheY-like chemotaxis protein